MAPTLLHGLDRLRQWHGLLLDAAGFGPVETPCRILSPGPGFRVRAYGGPEGGRVVVLVPAPIKQPYIWDLDPESSVVRRCLAAGLRVYMVEWLPADARAPGGGLADHGERFLAQALAIVSADCGGDDFTLAGHSLGGTLIAIFAALHPDRVGKLVLLEAPLAFGDKAGRFAPLVALAPDAGLMETAFGSVPGSFLNAASFVAAPDVFGGDVLRDRLASLMDAEDATLHARVRRWTLDEFPMPGRLFTDVVELLYRQDLFARGLLRIGERSATPRGLNMPILAVVDPESPVVPPESTLSALGGADLVTLEYRGDRGVALRHVGVLVGRSARAVLWPAILDWMTH